MNGENWKGVGIVYMKALAVQFTFPDREKSQNCRQAVLPVT
jgi:hypothetical protein